MKADTISLIPSESYTFNILYLAGFSLVLRYRTLCILPIYNIILFILETSAGILFANIVPADYKPINCDISWLGEKLKSKILLFNTIKIFSIFILLIKPLGYLIGFNFLFFNTSSTSPSI